MQKEELSPDSLSLDDNDKGVNNVYNAYFNGLIASKRNNFSTSSDRLELFDLLA